MKKLQSNTQINRAHFTAPFSYFVIESMLDGNTLAEAYTDQLELSNITVVWDGKYTIYCGGSGDKEQLGAAVEYISNQILTSEVRKDRGIVKVHYENQEWKDALVEGLQELNSHIYPRSIYRHSLEDIPHQISMQTDLELKQIDGAMLENKAYGNIQGLIGELELMWGSTEGFLKKGFGYCALKGNTITAWCTGEYFSNAWCGIGIETAEAYQRQGIASVTAEAFVLHCKKINKVPHWDCWKNNIPSVKTAEKLGFEKLADYEVLLLKFI